jgi:predicted deacylase
METKTLDIARVGAVELDIPILECGEGEPRVLILSGIHGDETESLFAVHRLLDGLEADLEGRLDVIPSAHPLAQVFEQRTSPLDDVDLNRNFHRRGPRRGLSDQTADVLMKRCLEYDFVLDLHTFENRAPVTCIYVDGGGEAIRTRNERAIRHFAPDIVWHADIEEAEGAFEGRLGRWLVGRGIPNIVVEMARDYHRDDARLQRVEAGVRRVLADLDVLDARIDGPPVDDLPRFDRHRHAIDRSGLFEPTVELGEPVEPDDVVGTITPITTFESSPVRAERGGRIITLSERDFVAPGDSILSIGQKTGVV